MKLVSAKVVAEYLGMKERTINGWAKKELIPHYRISRKAIRYNMEEIERWLDANHN